MLASLLLQGSAVIFSFIASWYIARQLGAVQYGVYAYAFQWAAMLSGLVAAIYDKLLLRQTAIYEHKQDTAHLKGVIRVSLYINSIGAIFAILLGYYIAQSQAWTSALTACVSGGIAASVGIALCQNYLTGMGKTTQARLPDLFIRPAALCLLLLITCNALFYEKIISAYVGNVLLLEQIAYCNAAAIFIAFFAALYYAFRAYLPTFRASTQPAYDWAIWLPAMRWLCLSGIVALVNARADILLLGYLNHNTADVGVYHIALRLADLLKIPLIALNAVIAPQIALLYQQHKKAQLQTYIKQKARWAFLASLSMAIVFILFGNILLSYWGSGFGVAYLPLCLLCIGQLVNVACGPVGNLLNMTGYMREAFTALFIATLISITLQLAFIPIWGVNGTALATMLGIVSSNIIMAYFANKKTTINATIF